MDVTYLDNGATTKVDPRVKDEIVDVFLNRYGNPSSDHLKGREAEEAVEESRESTAGLIGAEKDEIVFTSGGTESDNLGVLGPVKNRARGHMITTKIEHPAVHETCSFLESEGYEVTYLDVDEDGFVDTSDFESAIREDTVLASVMYANNEIGTIQPINKMAEIAHENGILFHTDAVQAVGKVDIDVKEEKIDLLSMSGHKFNGPMGVGALYVRDGIDLEPMMFGGGHEDGRRPGTENVPGIVGLGKACELADEEMVGYVPKMREQRDRIIDEVLDEIKGSHLNGPLENRLSNNVNFCFEDIDGNALVNELDKREICTSSAAACKSGAAEPSRVLLALGIEPELALSSLRITLDRFTKDEDVERILEVLPEIIEDLRGR